MNSQHVAPCPSPPASLLSRNPVRWLAIFGPGAVIASLTIGVGELVFSARAGALFGYRLLWLFLLVLALKWVLVFASARHIVLTGAHPFQRWMELPGPRGWLPLSFFLLAVPCFPIWVCFHAGTTGTLLSALTGTAQSFQGGAHLVWGIGVLMVVIALSTSGGYRTLERVQLGIVLLMLGAVVIAVFFLNPDWVAFFEGLFVPQSITYPPWITVETSPEFNSRPVWLEATTYVGIIGGSSYDYLAYVSYLRDKQWGRAGMGILSVEELQMAANDRGCRQWVRAPLVDCTLSFAAVLLFAAVFVICGAEVLGPNQKVPAGTNLLTLQAEFVAVLHPWFKPLYFAGAFLAVVGTLYGTIEVAPTILGELARAFRPDAVERNKSRLRLLSIGWVGMGGLCILAWSLLHHSRAGSDKPPGLIAILTPANLFTGVLGCGVICVLNVWMDRQFLPKALSPPKAVIFLGVLAGLLFLALGLRGYWDHSGWAAYGILAGTIALSWLVAWSIQRGTKGKQKQG